MIRHPVPRWDDGVISLIDNYVLYYPFKLNIPDLFYCIRRFVDAVRGQYEEHKSDERLFRI